MTVSSLSKINNLSSKVTEATLKKGISKKKLNRLKLLPSKKGNKKKTYNQTTDRQPSLTGV